VDQGGALVVDQELVEAEPLLGREGTDAVDAVRYLVDPYHRPTSGPPSRRTRRVGALHREVCRL
jgi:hypothetical protein